MFLLRVKISAKRTLTGSWKRGNFCLFHYRLNNLIIMLYPQLPLWITV